MEAMGVQRPPVGLQMEAMGVQRPRVGLQMEAPGVQRPRVGLQMEAPGVQRPNVGLQMGSHFHPATPRGYLQMEAPGVQLTPRGSPDGSHFHPSDPAWVSRWKPPPSSDPAWVSRWKPLPSSDPAWVSRWRPPFHPATPRGSPDGALSGQTPTLGRPGNPRLSRKSPDFPPPPRPPTPSPASHPGACPQIGAPAPVPDFYSSAGPGSGNRIRRTAFSVLMEKDSLTPVRAYLHAAVRQRSDSARWKRHGKSPAVGPQL